MGREAPLILVVDDQAGVRKLIQEVFKESGVRVKSAAHGQEAVAAAAEEVPDLVLLDMKMPVMDGLATLRILKHLYPDLIVLMMTAVGDGDRVNEALSGGASLCISKPFDVFALRQLVLELLSREE